MAKREILGTMVCPECGLEGAEIKAQKTGLLYRWCPDCNAQYFPRTAEASARLGMKAGIGSIPESVPAVPVTVTEEKTPKLTVTKQKPARVGFDMGL